RIYFIFFFSSRRRHTRFDCDWSSDVCSSDLKRKQRGVRARPVRPSRRDELWYKANLRAIVSTMKAATARVMLPFLKHQEPNYVKDSVLDDLLKAQLEKLAAEFGGIDGIAVRLATEAARRALDNTDKVLSKSIKAVTGVDITPA